jgi:hypothetical protein
MIYIIKLIDGEQELYMEYSTITDAPVTDLVPLAQFKQCYEWKHGKKDFAQRMQRVEEKGISSINYNSAEELLKNNRAGEGGKNISIREIIKRYSYNDFEKNKT